MGMKGFTQQITLNTNTTVDLSGLGQITHLTIFNRTGAILYVIPDVPNATPGIDDAWMAISNNDNFNFWCDNASEAPGLLRVRTGNTGYIHIVGW
jgi:hypothetical protein